MMEKIRGKDLVIDQSTNEMRQLKQTLKSQETSIAFFKKRVDEIQVALSNEKEQKQLLKLELTKQIEEARRQQSNSDASQDLNVGTNVGNSGMSPQTNGFENLK